MSNQHMETPISHSRELGNRQLTWLLMLGHLANDWVFGTLWIIAPAIAASMNLGPSEVGMILTITMVAAGVTYIPAGFLSDRIPNQGILLLITFWWVAIGYFLSTMAPGFWIVVLFLAFGSMGDAFWHPVATGVLVKRMPGMRAQVLGIHAMGGSAGAEILGPLAAGFLLGFFDWRTSLQILVLPAVIMGIVFIPLASRINIVSEKKITLADLASLAKEWLRPRGITMMGLMILYNMSLYGMLAMTPLTLQEKYGLSPLIAGVVFAATLVAGTACQPHTGKLSDTIGRKPVILGVITLAAGFAFAAGLFREFWPFVVCLILAVSLLTAVRPAILAAAVEYSKKSESTTLGVVFAILDGVGAFGALMAGYAGEFDLYLAYLLSAGLAVLAIILTLLLKFSEPG